MMYFVLRSSKRKIHFPLQRDRDFKISPARARGRGGGNTEDATVPHTYSATKTALRRGMIMMRHMLWKKGLQMVFDGIFGAR